jgi:hypothetical protein
MSDRDDQLIDSYYYWLREYNEKEYEEPRDPRRAREHERRLTKIKQELDKLAAQLDRNWQGDRKDKMFMREY